MAEPREAVPTEVRRRAVAAAQGYEPFDVVLGGGSVVDVVTGEVRRAEVGLVGPLIASVHEPGSLPGAPPAEDVIDCSGRFVAPGLVDMHVHFESSMLTPGAYASAVCPHGTTTVFCDPHELANVAGIDGVRYAVEASRGLPVRFVFQVPSCVPPLPGLELSGFDLAATDVAEMLGWPEVGGLAEVMDMNGVLGASPRMVAVVAAGLASGKIVSGHAAGLAGSRLQAYLAAGIDSDHELFAPGDLVARLRAGLTVELRGMIEGLLPEVVQVVSGLPELPVNLVACTDDLFALTLLEDGGVDHLLRRLVAAGMQPVRALRLATYHAACRLGRVDLGVVAAGRRADLVVLSDLPTLAVDDVWASGVRVASGGQMLVECAEGPASPPLHSMHVPRLRPEDFTMRLEAARELSTTAPVRVIDGVVATAWAQAEVRLEGGKVVLPPDHILQAVVHRHGRRPGPPRLALARGWGSEWTGAIATTVSHDTHNLVVFGTDPVSMSTAANVVVESEGGVAVARGTDVLASIALPVAGILSVLPAADVAEAQRLLQEAAISVGLPEGALTQPLLQCFTSALACLSGPHLTDAGLVDGTTGEIVESLLAS